MTDFLIRNIDPDLLDRLRARADANGRSLQAEIHRTLRDSVRLSRRESLTLIEESADRLPRFADESAALIREDRDAR